MIVSKTRPALWAGVVVAGVGLLFGSAVALRSPPADAATTPSAVDQSGSDPTFGAFLGACHTDFVCSDGNTCQSFKKRGSHCTHDCAQGSDCGVNGRCTKLARCGLNEPLKTEP